MKTTLVELLAAGRCIVADGAMGTELQYAGLEPGAPPELWNASHPERVRAVHLAYIRAGAQIVLTNSFGGNPARLALHELEPRCEELVAAAARLARVEADAARAGVLVAGSIGPTGQLLEPLGPLALDEAVAGFRRQSAALLDGGADLLWIETMSDLREVQAAIEGARQAGANAAIVVTLSFDTRGRTIMGVSPAQAAAALADLGVAAMGGNCGVGPSELGEAIEQMRGVVPRAALVAKPNAGLPRWEAGKTQYAMSADEFASAAAGLVRSGAAIIGGCCGSTPAHIAALARALARS